MITITDTELETTLKSLLQRDLRFQINKKCWRQGKLLIFKQNGFHIEFTIKNEDNKNERFEVPIPFDVITTPFSVTFSYKLSSLICNNHSVIDEIKKINPNCRSKYFDNCLEIKHD